MIKKAVSLILVFAIAAGILFPGARMTEAKAETDLADGLLGYWKFDGDTEDERLFNSAQGQSCTAEAVGSGVLLEETGGVSGGSARFSKQAQSYLKLNLKAAGAGLNASTDDFSVAAWIKLDGDLFQAGTDKIYLFQQTADASNTGAAGKSVLYLTSGRNLGTFLTGNDAVCDDAVTLGEWHHIVFTSDHAAKKAQFYIDGILAKEASLSGSFENAATDLIVGAHKNPEASSAIKGDMDELRYYNKVIDSAAVKAIYDEFGAEIKKNALAGELESLLEKAEQLNKGEGEEAEELSAKIAEARDLLSGGDYSAQELEEMLAALSDAVDAYKKTRAIAIQVDTADELREIPDAMFGINHRYHNDGYSSWNTTEWKIEDEFNEYVKEASFGSIRYPGGTVSNLYDWKRAIGDPSKRKKTIPGVESDPPITPNFGVDEAMGWIYDDLGSEAVWVYAMAQGSAADAADLFEYLNAPADGDETNPNGGIDWAEERAKNGHPKPYGVTRFEIGNEMGIWGQNYWMPGCGSSTYADMAKAYVNGGEMTFSNQPAVKEEDWRNAAKNSDGTPNQVRYAKYDPVIPGSATVLVGGTSWTIVDSLEGQAADDTVCLFEYETGKITFGDGVHGKIPASGQPITVSYKSNQDGFVKYYEKLKEIAGELGMEVEVYSCMEKEAAINALKQAGNRYDGAVIHPYSETSGGSGDYIKINDDDPLFYEKLLGRSLQYNMSRVQELKDHMGEGKVSVISEFGIYSHNSKFIRATGHAIYIANEMIDYIGLGTPYLNKHCLIDYPFAGDSYGPGSQCVIQAIKNGDDPVRFVSTPSAKAFSIFNHMTGSTQVGQTVEGNDTYYTYELNGGSYDVPTVKVLSSKDEEGNTFVTVVNNNKNDKTPIKIAVDDQNLIGREIAVWYLTSESVDDENTLEHPDLVDVEKTMVTGEGQYLEYTLEPHSITSFQIPAPKMVKITVEAGYGGTAEGSTEVLQGSKVTVTAKPDNDKYFQGWFDKNKEPIFRTVVIWYENCLSYNLSYSFFAREDVTLLARFGGYDMPPWLLRPREGEVFSYSVAGTDAQYKVVENQKYLEVSCIGAVSETQQTIAVPDYVIAEGYRYLVISIDADAFKNNKTLTSVTLGENIRKIGANAFSGCSSLKTVTIGKDLEEIGDRAFYQCKNLKKFTIPENVNKIGKQAFAKSKKLKKITIKTTRLSKWKVKAKAFQGISNKAVVKVPKNKLREYQKLLKSRGLPAGAKVKK